MNGIEISKGYFEEYGKPMLESDFDELLKYIAVGFVGSGSDKYGFDDELSKDHDFEPAFCIFLPSEEVVDRRNAFLLERAYAKLPKEYGGAKRQLVSAVGGNRNGVIRTADFYNSHIGSKDGELTALEWLHIPDYALFEATDGEVFFDNYGEFTKIRNTLLNMPEDVKLKRLAGNILTMAQSGQYNYLRCLKHGEYEAAQLACMEFVNAAMKTVFLLNGRYMPYYKWSFRALKNIGNTDVFCEKLKILLYGDNSNSAVAEEKYNTVEEIASFIISELQKRNITKAICGDLEKHAYSVNDFITDGNIRNLNIFAAV